MRDYEGIRPWVQRQMAGEQAVLTQASPAMYATTSGTTGEQKLIPVTIAWREEMAALTRLWMKRSLARITHGLSSRKTLTS